MIMNLKFLSNFWFLSFSIFEKSVFEILKETYVMSRFDEFAIMVRLTSSHGGESLHFDKGFIQVKFSEQKSKAKF